MKKPGTILILLATLVLGGIAVYTAVRLYQQGTQPVAPNVPGSTPSAADVTQACQAITFTVATPTPTPTAIASATPSPSPSASPTPTATPSLTPSPTPTQPPTGGVSTPTPTPTPTPVVTPAPTSPPVAQATPLASAPPIPVTGGELPTIVAILGAIAFIVAAIRFAL